MFSINQMVSPSLIFPFRYASIAFIFKSLSIGWSSIIDNQQLIRFSKGFKGYLLKTEALKIIYSCNMMAETVCLELASSEFFFISETD